MISDGFSEQGTNQRGHNIYVCSEYNFFNRIASKRVKTSTRTASRVDDAWDNLAKLYRGMNHLELYKAIYEAHIASSNLTKGFL
jgi:hypothetical protein